MHRDLLAFLECPACASGKLRLEDTPTVSADRILEGRLRCMACDRSFAIDGGVPNLLVDAHSKRVQKAFSDQWRWRLKGRFEAPYRIYGKPHAARVEALEERLRDSLACGGHDAWVLDAGCGTGEFVAAFARRYPEMQFIGIDFAADLEAAARRWVALPNLHFVRGDVTRPPFVDRSFRAVVALGVLHHTADTRAAFLAVAQLVRRGGQLSLWLYPHPSELRQLPPGDRRLVRLYYHLRDHVFLRSAHRLPPVVLFWCLRVLLLPVLLMPLPRHPARHDVSRAELYAGLVFVLFDGLAPEFQHRHTSAEVCSWFREARFTDIRRARSSRFPDHSLGAFTGSRA